MRSIINRILGIIAILEWILLYVLGASSITGKVLAVSILAIMIYMIIKSFVAKDYIVFILFAFMFNYTLVPFNYYFYDISMTRSEAINSHTVYNVALSLFLFISLLLFQLKIKDSTTAPPLSLRSDIVYKFCFVLGLIMTTFLLTGDNILSSGGYGQGETQTSTLMEYSIIPISLCLIFADTKSKRIWTYILALFFVIKILFYGGRIGAVMLAISLFIIRFQYKLSRKQIVVIILLGVIFMSAFGTFRGYTLGGFEYLKTAFLSSFSSFSSDGQYTDVYYASVRIIYLIENGILDVASRVQSFLLYLISAFVPGSALGHLANLSSYMTDSYSSGGGGLCTTFFYAYLGWFGVIILALFIGKMLNLYKTTHSEYIRFYIVLLIVVSPRWFAYYPIHIIKLCLWGLVFFYLMRIVRKKVTLKEGGDTQ